jgi:hypothetical protein
MERLTKDAPWRACDNVLPIVQLPDVLPDVGAPDAGMALHIHVVPQSEQALDQNTGSCQGATRHTHHLSKSEGHFIPT